MVTLRCHKSPYKSFDGRELWEGNLIYDGGPIELYEVRCENNNWFAVALPGTFIEKRDERRLLGILKNVMIFDDKTTLSEIVTIGA